MKKIIFTISLSMAVLAVAIVFVLKRVGAPGNLEVSFFDVGQGDSELIETPNHKLVLIDGGPDNLVLRRLGESLPFYKRNIDYVILSHFHDDHIIGLVEVFKRYEVKNFIYADGYDSETLSHLLKIASAQKTKITKLGSSARIKLESECFFNLLNPTALKVKADQNNSIISKLDCRKNEFLFSGDNSLYVEKALLNSNFDIKAQVLKASHHGSKSANSEAFLIAVSPLDFIVSAGIDNRFGHPSQEIVEQAEDLGLRIYRTDTQGTIKISGFIR